MKSFTKEGDSLERKPAYAVQLLCFWTRSRRWVLA